MEEAEPAADPSGSRKKQQNGDGGLKFCQMSSHGQFVGDDPCHMLEHAPSSLRRWAWVLHLTSAGLQRLPGCSWLLHHFSSREVKLRGPVLSGSGGFIAVLHGSTVTIFTQIDDFKHPTGNFSAVSQAEEFLNGAWIDDWQIFVVASSSRIIYFLDSKAKELSRFNVAEEGAKVAGMFTAQIHGSGSRLPRYDLVVLASNGKLLRYELDKDTIPLLPLHHAADAVWDVSGPHPWEVWSLFFHPEESVIVVAGPARGSNFTLSIWRLSGSPLSLELLYGRSTPLGLAQRITWPCSWSPKRFLTMPKVIISPNAQFVALLHPEGRLHVKRLRRSTDWSLEDLTTGQKNVHSRPEIDVDSEEANRETHVHSAESYLTLFTHGVEDFGWWCDQTLIVASKKSGSFELLQLPCLKQLWAEAAPALSSPVRLSRVLMGRVFFVKLQRYQEYGKQICVEPTHEKQTFVKRCISLYAKVTSAAIHSIVSDSSKLGWQLLSLVERSEQEMYSGFVEQGKYDLALKFAEKYGLDTDDVFKAQWKKSDYGRESVQRLLPTIKDLKWIVNECLDKVCSSTEAMTALLEYGLSVTQPFVKGEGQECIGEDPDQVWWFSLKRLRLLHHRDRLDTFLAIHLGRFFPEQYSLFRAAPVSEIAIKLAEEGKTGSLELLMKRHLHSLAPHLFTVLDSIPETLAPHSYRNILPSIQAPSAAFAREDADWVENKMVLEAIRKGAGKQELLRSEVGFLECTEHMVFLSVGLMWPSEMEIVEWYRRRARGIDKASGQLENSLTLLNVGLEKGVTELDCLFEDVSDLYWLVFGAGDVEDVEVNMSLSEWEQLNDSDKFSCILRGATPLDVVDKLRERGVPFMRRKYRRAVARYKAGEENRGANYSERTSGPLVEWLRQSAEENKLEMCASVLSAGCRGPEGDWIFEDETELVTAALECVYSCKQTDQWSLLGDILRNLPRNEARSKEHVQVVEAGQPMKGLRGGLASVFRHAGVAKSLTMLPLVDAGRKLVGGDSSRTIPEELDERLRQAEGFVDVGRLLSSYQVHVSMSSLLATEGDQNARKQYLRSLLARFTRRQPGRSDNDWINLWQDFRAFHESSQFLDKEYLLAEFCRGLLKAGKLSLAKSYLKGNATSVVLPKELVEKIVLHAAREYFYAASSLDSSEIEIAKECLALIPDSENANAEANLFEAVSTKLPVLGVTLLPMEFRQMTSRLEVIKTALSARPDAYLDVQELINVSKLLGLTSPDDIAEVEVAIARKAFDAGDVELTRELCLEVVKKGYAPVWDLCSAVGRRSELDLTSRKELLEFAVNHCDPTLREDLQTLSAAVRLSLDNLQKEKEGQVSSPAAEEKLPSASLFSSSAPTSPSFREATLVASESLQETDKQPEHGWAGHRKGRDSASASNATSAFWRRGREYLSKVTKATHISSLYSSEVVARKKIIGFSCLELPWLVELGLDKAAVEEELSEEKWAEVTRATYVHACKVANLDAQEASDHSRSQMGGTDSPDDTVLLKLAHEAFNSPVSRVGDIVGCGYLLNLSNPLLGVQVFEKEWGNRSEPKEIVQLMNMALIYCQLHHISVVEGLDVEETPSEGIEGGCSDVASPGFWKNWRLQIEGKKNLMKYAQLIKQITPSAEMKRFASGDSAYIKNIITGMVESLVGGQLHLLTQILEVAKFYGVGRSEVLLRFLFSLLLSTSLSEEKIKAEVSLFWDELSSNPSELLQALIVNVYPGLDGVNKKRLSYFYGLLADCCSAVGSKEMSRPFLLGMQDSEKLQSAFLRKLAEECLLLDPVAPELNFKNLIGIDDFDPVLATNEISKFVDESNVRRFADFVSSMHPYMTQVKSRGEIQTSQSIYLVLVKRILGCFPSDELGNTAGRSIGDLEDAYSSCRMYLGYLAPDQLREVLHVLVLGSINLSLSDAVDHEHMLARKGTALRESSIDSVILLWIQALEDVQLCLSYHENPSNPAFYASLDEMLSCLKGFARSVGGRVKPKQGLAVLDHYIHMAPFAEGGHDSLKFLKSMILAGCPLQNVVIVADKLVTSASTAPGAAKLATVGSLSSERSFAHDGPEDVREDLAGEGAAESRPVPSCKKDPDALDLYLQLIDYALGAEDSQSSSSLDAKLDGLKGILTSLSSSKDDTFDTGPAQHSNVVELLSKLRAEVCRQMWSHVKDTSMEFSCRMSVFELLEATQGKQNATDEPLILWEGWDGDQQVPGNVQDVELTRFMSVMRSTRILFRLWPGIQISEQDIATAEAAALFFTKLEAGASSANHAVALKLLLEEWDGLFDLPTTETAEVQGSSKGTDGWDGWDEEDDWGEGWQDYSEPRSGSSQKLVVHPLHSCWKSVLHKLLVHRCEREALQVLDSALVCPSKVLVTEDEVKELVGKVGERSALTALKLALLLPYEFSRCLALQLLVQDLESGDDDDDRDVLEGDDSSPYESLLALVLAAGILPAIAANQEMHNIFSALVVPLRRLGQKLQQQRLQEGRKGQKQNPVEEGYIPLYRVAFPFSVAELTGAKLFEDAGALVLQYMRVPSARATKSAAVSALKSYLQSELSVERRRDRCSSHPSHEKGSSKRFESYLLNTMQVLDRRLGEVLRKAEEAAEEFY